jgi:ribonuclease P/MRP protein subunit POP5
MREKKRYLLARIEPRGLQVDPKDLYYAVLESLTSLYGDFVSSQARPAVISAAGGYAIIRCTRGYEDLLRTALTMVTGVNDVRLVLRSCATSGTIHGLKKRIAAAPGVPATVPAELEIGGKCFDAYHYGSEKVDLIEKGFKNQELLFLTQTDLEEF